VAARILGFGESELTLSKSFLTILPPGPEPEIIPKSIPLDLAIFFASGDALTLSLELTLGETVSFDLVPSEVVFSLSSESSESLPLDAVASFEGFSGTYSPS
jgi:hypothetical protein